MLKWRISRYINLNECALWHQFITGATVMVVNWNAWNYSLQRWSGEIKLLVDIGVFIYNVH